MKLREVRIHNYRSIVDVSIQVHDFTLLVGANNAGKSTVVNAIRAFYDDLKWSAEDFPKFGAEDSESWVQLQFQLDDDEWEGLADKYKEGADGKSLTLRRYFKAADKVREKTGQSNIFGFINGAWDTELFYGAKNVGAAKVGQIIYVPALTTSAEQTKMSGPSPLRNILNFLLKKVVASSDAYRQLATAFKNFNEEARQGSGFLNEVSTPLNAALASWNIKIDLEINTVAPEDISKSMIGFSFVDSALDNVGFDLDRYGHGFQRSVIYELIRLAPAFKEKKQGDKKEFSPNFSLMLFEEPEAFLHPSQQECMAYHLRRLGAESCQQVIITTHSPIFAGKASEQICQIARMQRVNGSTKAFQPKSDDLQSLFEGGGNFLNALRTFIANPRVPDGEKKRARAMVIDPPEIHIAEQEEQFRYQLWLDSERASLFFADKVLLVEGATERALFNYLLANEWHDLNHRRVYIVDVLGKFNLHRYMLLLKVFGIPHGVMLDDDNRKHHHGAVNDLIDGSRNWATLAAPVKFPNCLEEFLGLPIPDRDDKKPIEMIKAITENRIDEERLRALRASFCSALGL